MYIRYLLKVVLNNHKTTSNFKYTIFLTTNIHRKSINYNSKHKIIKTVLT